MSNRTEAVRDDVRAGSATGHVGERGERGGRGGAGDLKVSCDLAYVNERGDNGETGCFLSTALCRWLFDLGLAPCCSLDVVSNATDEKFLKWRS